MFAQFKLVYHNQFVKAFPDDSALSLARQLWHGYLRDVPPDIIMAACHRAIRESEFLPTVRGILKYCEAEEGLPPARLAYREACEAGHPRAAQAWSHPLVYHAGLATGWHYLASTPEPYAFPVFRTHYEQLIQRYRQGERFTVTPPESLPAPEDPPLSAEEKHARLTALKRQLEP